MLLHSVHPHSQDKPTNRMLNTSPDFYYKTVSIGEKGTKTTDHVKDVKNVCVSVMLSWKCQEGENNLKITQN